MQPILEQIKSCGYAQIDETDLGISTMEVAKELLENIDTIVSDFAETLVASPLGEKPKNTYGGNYGYGMLPLHTDLAHWHRPPRYVMLRCIIPANSVKTYLLHRRLLNEWIPESIMQDALFSPRRRLEGKLFLLRMQVEELVRWDQLFLKPQNRAAKEVVVRMQEVSSVLPVSDVIFDRPGKTLIIDNWNVLHGRSAVPGDEINRAIDRIYMENS